MFLLRRLRDAGLSLEAGSSSTLRVRPRALLTPEHRQAILSEKQSILAALNLEQRINAMAARWRYAPEELNEALTQAGANPEAWLRAVEDDEKQAALSVQVGTKYPP